MSIVNNLTLSPAVNSTIGNAIEVDPDGRLVIKKLALVDEKTGRKWEVKISDGELISEPLELEDKRDHKISKIFKK